MWERLDRLLTEVSSRVCCQVLSLQGMVLTLVFFSGGFIHSRRRSYYLS